MAYTPTNWQTGDTITAEKLNNMESGIAENDGYWIPLEVTAGGLAVPADKQDEVSYMVRNPSLYIQGCLLSTGTDISGYRVLPDAFHCPLSSEAAPDFGVYGTANIVVKYVGGEGVVVEVVPDVFVITLTPTAQDFSGTMDATPAEIKTAYEQGCRIRFDIPSLGAAVDATQYIVTADSVQAAANITYEVLGIGDVLIQVLTSSSDSTYTTKIFPLTPMS